MHVLFVHQNFPAQFGHIAARLVSELGWRCTFIAEQVPRRLDGIEGIRYVPRGGATEHNSFHTRTFENTVAHAEGIYDAVKARPDLEPDLVVGHSGLGSTIFLRELLDAPTVGYFEYYYQPRSSDIDFRPDVVATEQQRLRVRVRNAMTLLDLQNCDAGYTPTAFQWRCLPPEYRPKIEQIFDGVDVRVYRRLRRPGRTFGGRTIAPDTRIVTYCASAFERVRGFDIFMRAARIIYRRHPNVVFLVVGSDRSRYGDDLDRAHGHRSFREYVMAQDDYDRSKFVFLGLIPPLALARVLSAGDAHIYLTVPFVLGWSMMDALACGAVVVGSDTEPVREMISPGDNGFLVDFFDPEAIAEQTLEVLRAPAAFEPVRRNAVRFIQERYSVDAVLPKMVALYESAVKAGLSTL
jgi:glycosyltransferase involved in cell wall biosynthesis